MEVENENTAAANESYQVKHRVEAAGNQLHSFTQQSNKTVEFIFSYPAGNYMFKVDNRKTRTRCETCLKLTTKTLGRHHKRRTGVLIFNFEHIYHLF